MAASHQGWVSKRRLEQERDEGDQHELRRRQQRDDTEELPDVDGGPVRRRQQQGAERLRLTLALERAAEGERPGKGNRDPEDARGPVVDRAPVRDEREGKHQHARDREEERRIRDLAAADFDRQILAEDEPGRAEEHQALGLPITARYVERNASGRGSDSSMRPSRRNTAWSRRPSAMSRSCVARITMAPPLAQDAEAAEERRGRGVVESGERLIQEHEARLVDQRAFEGDTLAHAS